MIKMYETYTYDKLVVNNSLTAIKDILTHDDYDDHTQEEKYECIAKEIIDNLSLKDRVYNYVDEEDISYKDKYVSCKFCVGRFYFLKYRENDMLNYGQFKLVRVLKKTSCGFLINYDIFYGIDDKDNIDVNKIVNFDQILTASEIIYDNNQQS